jgi:hypothetical protein
LLGNRDRELARSQISKAAAVWERKGDGERSRGEERSGDRSVRPASSRRRRPFLALLISGVCPDSSVYSHALPFLGENAAGKRLLQSWSCRSGAGRQRRLFSLVHTVDRRGFVATSGAMCYSFPLCRTVPIFVTLLPRLKLTRLTATSPVMPYSNTVSLRNVSSYVRRNCRKSFPTLRP